MKNICTVSDIKYLYQGLALFESLSKSENITLHYLCIDQISYDILKNIKDNKLIIYNINDLLNNDNNLINLKNSDYRYFCWSLASYFSNHLLSKNVGDSITYIDSDIYFHEKIELLFESFSKKDVGIFRHRQFSLSISRPEGHYNVGVVYFKNSDIGKNVLNWWSDAVLHKKYPHLSTCGDQKYLEEFPRMCSNIFIDGEIGHGAPWQWQLFNFDNYENDGTIIWEGKKQKLIFSHFSQFNYNLENDTYLPSSQHHIYTPLTMYTENKGLKIIYDDYFNKIKKTYIKYNT
jgi:hypothetical protein